MASLKTKVRPAIQMNHVEPFGFRVERWFVGVVRIRPFQSAMDEFGARVSTVTATIREAQRDRTPTQGA